MATVPSWQTRPSAWDKLLLGTDWLPGPVQVDIQEISSGLDIRKAPKTNRAVLVDQGYNPVKATITLTIGFNPIGPDWPSAVDQFALWQGILGRIRPKRAQKQVAITVSHPQFQIVGVSKVFVVAVSGLMGRGPGVRTVTIRVVEQAPVVPAAAGSVQVAQPKGSTSISTLKKAPDPATNETGPG